MTNREYMICMVDKGNPYFGPDPFRDPDRHSAKDVIRMYMQHNVAELQELLG
jgi:hypothetical protein